MSTDKSVNKSALLNLLYERRQEVWAFYSGQLRMDNGEF